MKLHRDLRKDEEPEFRQWARDNFKFFNANDYKKHIGSTWHPVVQDECEKMRLEYKMGLKMRLAGVPSKDVESHIRAMRQGYEVMNNTIA